MSQTQTYKNHARVVPVYHIGVFFSLMAFLCWSGYRLFQGVTGETVVGLVLALALLLMFFSLRVQILTVQDRVIRLEMRLRLRELLPPELAARASSLSVKQLIALRFACDAELPELVREVIDGRLHAPKDIKQRVKEWQADFLRA
jgi:uncharacterized protein DUF6526